MRITLIFLSAAVLFTGCAGKKKLNASGLEKYPLCYHKNVKISNACIMKNDKGETVTAAELENTAYPGQYK